MATTEPILTALHISIAVLISFTLKWPPLSGPTTTVGASQTHCRVVGRDYLGEPYSASGSFDIHSVDDMDRFSSTNEIDDSLAEQRRGRDKVIEGCSLVRDNRKFYMNLTVIFAVTASITLLKSAQKKSNFNFLKLKRKDEFVTVAESQ